MVNQVNGVAQAVSASGMAKAKAAYSLPKTMKMEDSVQLSSDIMRVRSANTESTRLTKIGEIRQQLDRGIYLTPEKLNVALDRALDDVLKQIL